MDVQKLKYIDRTVQVIPNFYKSLNVNAYVMYMDHSIDGSSINIMHPFFNCLTITVLTFCHDKVEVLSKLKIQLVI